MDQILSISLQLHLLWFASGGVKVAKHGNRAAKFKKVAQQIVLSSWSGYYNQ